MIEMQKLMADAYLQCESELLEPRSTEIDVRINRNHAFIIVKRIPATGQKTSDLIRSAEDTNGIRKAFSGVERKQFYSMLIHKLTEVTGCRITSVQTGVSVDAGENIEMIHFDCDLESKCSNGFTG